MKFKGSTLFIFLIWGGAITLILFIKQSLVDEDNILVKEGIAINVKCFETRTLTGLKFNI